MHTHDRLIQRAFALHGAALLAAGIAGCHPHPAATDGGAGDGAVAHPALTLTHDEVLTAMQAAPNVTHVMADLAASGCTFALTDDLMYIDTDGADTHEFGMIIHTGECGTSSAMQSLSVVVLAARDVGTTGLTVGIAARLRDETSAAGTPARSTLIVADTSGAVQHIDWSAEVDGSLQQWAASVRPPSDPNALITGPTTEQTRCHNALIDTPDDVSTGSCYTEMLDVQSCMNFIDQTANRQMQCHTSYVCNGEYRFDVAHFHAYLQQFGLDATYTGTGENASDWAICHQEPYASEPLPDIGGDQQGASYCNALLWRYTAGDLRAVDPDMHPDGPSQLHDLFSKVSVVNDALSLVLPEASIWDAVGKIISPMDGFASMAAGNISNWDELQTNVRQLDGQFGPASQLYLSQRPRTNCHVPFCTAPRSGPWVSMVTLGCTAASQDPPTTCSDAVSGNDALMQLQGQMGPMAVGGGFQTGIFFAGYCCTSDMTLRLVTEPADGRLAPADTSVWGLDFPAGIAEVPAGAGFTCDWSLAADSFVPAPMMVSGAASLQAFDGP